MQKLKELRAQNKTSQQKLADYLNVSRSTVAMWEAGSSEPDLKILSEIADYFGVTVDYLMGREESAASTPPDPSVPGAKWIPVLGTIPAGIPVETVQDIIDYEEISPQMAAQGEHFALQVSGHSMEPKISDGDVVIVRKQEDAESGDICVVMVNGDDATVKRIKKRPEGLMLIPSNPDYEPMFYTNEQIDFLPVRILGRVVELRAKF